MPFAHGTRGKTFLDVFNPGRNEARVFVIAVAPNGRALGSGEIALPPHGNFHGDVAALLGSALAPPNETSHLLVRAATNVFQVRREVVASALIKEYGDLNEDVTTRTDEAISRGSSEATRTAAIRLPLFVDGAGFFSLLQVINTADSTQSVTIRALSQGSQLIAGTNNPASISLGAGASHRENVGDLFGFDENAVAMGSIVVEGSGTLNAVVALGTTLGTSLAIVDGSQIQGKNAFVFNTEEIDREFFNGIALVNPHGFNADILLSVLRADGARISQVQFTVPPYQQRIQNLSELLPEIEGSGFVVVQTETPIVAAAITGSNSGTTLRKLPFTDAPSGIQIPAQEEFLAVGSIRSGGAAIPGASVLLSGPVSGVLIADSSGTFAFRDIPAGSYTLTAGATGFALSPPIIGITITDSNSRNNDFEGTLIVPVIGAVTPPGVLVGSDGIDVAITGGPFISTSQVIFEGSPLPTNLVDSNTLGIRLEANQLTLAREGELLVKNTGPDNRTASSIATTFSVGKPSPVITALRGVPDEVVAGRLTFNVTVEGSGFESGALGLVNGIAQGTAFLNETEVVVNIPSEDLVSGGNLAISVLNPSPTAGPSNELSIGVLNPIAGLRSISPDLIVARPDESSPPVPLTVVGFSFVKGATVLIEDEEIATEFVNSTTLTALIPAKSIPDGQAKRITVKNPEPVVPRVPPSETLPLMVVNPIPVLESLSFAPTSFEDGRPFRLDGETEQKFKALLIVNGANFNSATTAFFGLPACMTPEDFDGETGTLLNSNQMVFEFTVICSGSWTMTMENAQPGGGSSQTLGFTVGSTPQTNAVPNIASLSPSSITAGSATFDMTITGSNFTSASTVLLGTAVLTPTSVTSAQIVISVPSILVGSSGVLPIAVTDPNGGTSNRLFFTVN